MAVEAIADIRSVRNTLYDSIHLAELLNLKTTEALCRCSVDRIEVSVLLLELVYFVIDIFQYFQCKLSILADRFAVVKLLKLIQGCDPEGSCHRFEDLADLFVRFEMTAVETALTVSKRVRGCSHLSQVLIGADVEISDHLQVKIKNLVKISALCSCFRQDHRKMKTDCTDIETSYKYRLVILICRIHAASLIPWT